MWKIASWPAWAKPQYSQRLPARWMTWRRRCAGTAMRSRRPATRALGTQANQGEDFTQVHQSLSFAFFRCRQTLSLVLLVQEFLKAFLNTPGQPKSGQVTRHLYFNFDGL